MSFTSLPVVEVSSLRTSISALLLAMLMKLVMLGANQQDEQQINILYCKSLYKQQSE